MQLDYESRAQRGFKNTNAITRFLMKPVSKVTIAIYFTLWMGLVFFARLPPRYHDDMMGLAILTALLNAPLIARFCIRCYLCRSLADHQSGKWVRAAVVLAVLLPLIILVKLPMIIGFTLSHPAMERLRQWALLHPGAQLPPQRVGVYWAEGITATPDGVRFRVCGSPGEYGSRSGFASGSTLDEVKEADAYPTWDPAWKAWGWDY